MDLYFLNLLWSVLMKLGIIAVCLMGILFLLLWIYQERLLFYPNTPNRSLLQNPANYRTPETYNVPFDEVYLPMKDKVKVHIWFLKQTQKKNCPTLIFFHGNAANIGYYLPFFRYLYLELDANIVAVSYRGYGNSTGEPNERGMLSDANEILSYILKEYSNLPFFDKKRIFLYGRSLGGSVAIHTAALSPHKDHIAGVIVENTFTSIVDMGLCLFPFLSPFLPILHFLVRIRFESIAYINKVECPMLFLAGEKDELVPSIQMKKLYEQLMTKEKDTDKSPQITYVSFPNGTHNDTWNSDLNLFIKSIQKFIQA